MRTSKISRAAVRVAFATLVGLGVVGFGGAAHADDYEWQAVHSDVTVQVIAALPADDSPAVAHTLSAK